MPTAVGIVHLLVNLQLHVMLGIALEAGPGHLDRVKLIIIIQQMIIMINHWPWSSFSSQNAIKIYSAHELEVKMCVDNTCHWSDVIDHLCLSSSIQCHCHQSHHLPCWNKIKKKLLWFKNTQRPDTEKWYFLAKYIFMGGGGVGRWSAIERDRKITGA